MKKEGIYSEPIAPYRLNQNEIAEHVNRIVIECMQAIFIKSNLIKKLWLLVFNVTLYIKNRILSIAIFNHAVIVMY